MILSSCQERYSENQKPKNNFKLAGRARRTGRGGGRRAVTEEIRVNGLGEAGRQLLRVSGPGVVGYGLKELQKHSRLSGAKFLFFFYVTSGVRTLNLSMSEIVL